MHYLCVVVNNTCVQFPFLLMTFISHWNIPLQASNAYEAGAYEEALSAASTAKTVNIVGLIVGIAVFVAVCVLIGVSTALQH